MQCAARGSVRTRCMRAPTRRCGRCGAVSYCSVSHQISHWNDHKEECTRFEQQMRHADVLHDFPFMFSVEATPQVTLCSFLTERGLHQMGMWKSECSCGPSVASSDSSWIEDDWNLPSALCPCSEPISPISMRLSSWDDYYQWRCLPLHSPVALLLHWPLTIYHGIQLTGFQSSISGLSNKLHIHYLGPDKELLQLSVFGELHALFPGLQLHIELIGPEVPEFRIELRVMHIFCFYCYCYEYISMVEGNSKASPLKLEPDLDTPRFKSKIQKKMQDKKAIGLKGEKLIPFGYSLHNSKRDTFFFAIYTMSNELERDGERINLHSYAYCSGKDCSCKSQNENASWGVLNDGTSVVTLQLRRGFYHEQYRDIVKDSFPHFVIAPNAGIAAYSSWLPTIELIKDMGVPAIFSDYCEEAAHLAACCLRTVIGRPLTVPIQINPFRQPMVVEDSALYLPCYSNCFLMCM